MPTPLQVPIRSYPTPNIPRPAATLVDGDALITEIWDSKTTNYVAIEYGTPHPDATRYPNFYLIHQEPIGDGDTENRLVKKVWAKDRFAQDTDNAQIKFVQEGANYPIYIRTYMFPRGTAFLADQSPLTTVVSLILTSGGTGYTGDDFGRILLSFAGGGGAGAEGYGIVVDGVITNVYLTDGGDGYTSVPTVSAGGGVGAVITATIQSQTAYLVSQQSQPAPEPYTSRYDIYTRIYHTLPGPTLISWVWNKTFRTFVKIEKTIIQGTLVPGTTPVKSNGVITEYQPIDNNRAVKIVSTLPDLPAPYVLPTVVGRYPLPNTIVGTPSIFYVWASNGETFAIDVGMDINIREGYEGPYKGRITQYFTFSPTTENLPDPTVFNPQAHTVSMGLWFFNANQSSARAISFAIPQTIHQELTFSTRGSSGSAATSSVTIPATVPPTLPATNEWIVISATQPQQVDLDVWMYEVLEIQIPSFI